MERSSKLTQLQEKTGRLLAKALTQIQQGLLHAPKAEKRRFEAAVYVLSEAEEYVRASWDLLRAGSPRVSLATSRWVLEAALNFTWVTKDPKEVDERLRCLMADALRLEDARLDGLAELYPNDAKQLKDAATAARGNMKELVGEVKRPLDSLNNRVESMRVRMEGKSVPDLYPLYRICCAAAHPGLDLHRRFDLALGGATVTRKLADDTDIAIFISAASAQWLVSSAYCLTDLGNADCLNRWWKDEIRPLLTQ